MLAWASAHPGWLLLAGFLLAFLEALALVGIVLPGIFMLFVLGALVGWNPPQLAMLGTAVMAGAIAGDGVSFWLGRRYRDRLRTAWPFATRRHWLDNAEQFIHSHGGKSVFIGRFVGPLRPVVPLVAGSLGMPAAMFVPRMLIACAMWTPLMLLPGAIFGESLALAAEFGGRLTLLLAVVVLGGWLLVWLARTVYEGAARRAPWWLKKLAVWLRRHPVLGHWFGALVEPGRREMLTVVILGLLLVASIAALFAALLFAPLSKEAWEAGFELSGLAASLRSHFADPLFFALILSTSRPVLLVLIAVTALILLVQRRWNALIHWLLATLGGGLLALLLNALMGALLGRPAQAGTVGEVPNLHFVLAVLVFGFASLIVAKDFRPRQRKWLYLVTILLLALIAFADFYLARATLNGLLSALALGLGWLAFTGIGYRTRASTSKRPGLLLGAFIVCWGVVAALWVPAQYGDFARHHELSQPRRTAGAGEWWLEAWRLLPRQRSRVGPASTQWFDAQVAVERERFMSALRRAGWGRPPSLRPRTLRTWFGPRVPLDERVLMPRDFAGQPEDVLVRRVEPEGRIMVLRAWDSGMRLQPGDVPVWLVQLRTLRPIKRLGFVNGFRPVDESAWAPLQTVRTVAPQWAWRRIEANPPLLLGTAVPIDERAD